MLFYVKNEESENPKEKPSDGSNGEQRQLRSRCEPKSLRNHTHQKMVEHKKAGAKKNNSDWRKQNMERRGGVTKPNNHKNKKRKKKWKERWDRR